jgi:hypothetical protein
LQDFEQCALACAVATDDADDFAPFNLEVDILKRLKFFDDFAFKNLPPVEYVECLTCKVPPRATDGIAQQCARVTQFMTNQVTLR